MGMLSVVELGHHPVVQVGMTQKNSQDLFQLWLMLFLLSARLILLSFTYAYIICKQKLFLNFVKIML